MLKRLIILLVLVSLSSPVFAQRFNKQDKSYGSRNNRWESSFLMGYQAPIFLFGERRNNNGAEIFYCFNCLTDRYLNFFCWFRV